MGVKISDKNFAELLRERAEACDPEFQYRVGRCYMHGKSIDQNATEAIKWLELAAEQGHAIALYRLACCYLGGEGVTQDISKALGLYSLSAKRGYWWASFCLGKMYQEGKDVKQDLAKAKQYYEKALTKSNFKDNPAREAGKIHIQERIVEINLALAEAEEKKRIEAETQAKAARMAARTQVFISYARKDANFLEKWVHPSLKKLERTAEITWWDDTKINPGDIW